jgi:hypothetical protein
MSTSTIIWTALPNGFSSASAPTQMLRLSAFVSPRLQFDASQKTGALAAFADFLDWPGRLSNQFTIDVIIDNDFGHPLSAQIVTQPPPDSTLWAALFDPTTFVRGHEFPIQRDPVSSYASNKLQQNLYVGFGEVGQAAPYRLPDATTLKRAFPDVFNAVAPASAPADLRSRDNLPALSDAELATLHRQIGENLLRSDPSASFSAKLAMLIDVAGEITRRSSSRAPIPLVPATASAFVQFAAFHRRVPQLPSGVLPESGSDDDPNKIDFHQILTALGEYPDLLRRLGLIIDLEIAADLVPASVFGQVRRLRLQPNFPGGGLSSAHYTPNTLYLLDRRLTGSLLPFPIFAAAPQRSDQPNPPASLVHDLEIVAGLLNLGMTAADGGPLFSLVQIDIDGAAIKILNAVNAIILDQQRSSHPIDNPDTSRVPAFRTGGVSLARSGHASALIEGVRRSEDHQRALQSQQPADFYADDLVRGYRVDVQRSSIQRSKPPPWRSLHQRVGNYVARRGQPGSVTLSNIVDEGFLQPAFVQTAPTTTVHASANPIYVPESMFRWQGFSLSAPPPANPVSVIPPTDSAGQNAPVGLPQLDVDFAPVPGTLPRLRFGSFYQVRARIVDLAGNGPSVADADGVVGALAAQGSQTPILPDQPQKFRYRRFEPIAAPELVLREVLTEGETVDVMVIRSNGSTTAAYAASLGEPYKAENERHIVPPKAALSMVESHGRLDGAIGQNGNPGAFYNLCQRERGTLNDGFIINVTTGNQDPLPDQVLTDPNGVQTTIPNGIRFVSLPGSATSGYTVHYEPTIGVPYLPDPIARGAALFGLPAVVNTTGQLDQQGSNLNFSAPEGQVLDLPATQDLGFVTKIDFGPEDAWPNLVPFRLTLAELDRHEFPVLPEWSIDSGNGSRELRVRLAPGHICTAWISSYPAPADVDLLGLYSWWSAQAPPSTDDKYFLNMAQHGALSLLSPPRKLRLVHAVQQPVDPPLETTDSPLRVVKFANDTTAYIAGAFKIHSLSTAKLDLIAEWEEQGEGPDDTALHAIRTHVFEVAIPPPPPPPGSTAVPIATFESDRLDFQAPKGAIIPAQRYLARHDFGDTKYRLLTYDVVATTRFREYFPKSITANLDNLSKTFSKLDVVVPSSATPPAPEISYIAPSFGWLVDRVGSQVTQSTRRGGGLRVYLGDKWYRSGAGEQLAVVEAPSLNRSGFDPVHVSADTPAMNPIVPDAPAAPAPGSPYDGLIYPYDVQFDTDQKLWYCDLKFQVADGYFPFRELALARYQSNSLPGKHLSPLVYAGIYQLAPDRAVALAYAAPTPSDPNHRRVTMTVSALAPGTLQAGAAAADSPPFIEIVLEQRDAARQGWDENLGWTPAPPDQQPVVDSQPSPSQPWTGHLLLPSDPGSMQRRIVVREFELFTAVALPPGQAWIGDDGGTARRLVYADTIRLD